MLRRRWHANSSDCPDKEPVKEPKQRPVVGEYVRYRHAGVVKVVEAHDTHGRVERPNGELWVLWYDGVGQSWDRIRADRQEAAHEEFEVIKAGHHSDREFRLQVRPGDLRRWYSTQRPFVVESIRGNRVEIWHPDDGSSDSEDLVGMGGRSALLLRDGKRVAKAAAEA